ncbi:hypothetical protein [Tunturibacter empetritectus]|uniref:Uncharacterized protein n=1 Tax=Tunturiibacter lichenicola TaxID=2051959 RepID=A0A7W8J3W6_9BACT|nr:hypothetical protein [Edaphobacter lichenicola]MBB5342133.1 hypothetical protein [Edaphobacter lichenicola]
MTGNPDRSDHGRLTLIGAYLIAALLAIVGAVLALKHVGNDVAFTIFGQEFTRGGIAAAGLFLAAVIVILVSRSAARRSRSVTIGDIRTAGSGSPGFVGGDYGSSAPTGPAAPIEKVKMGGVTTLGDQSPGVVMGNFTVHIDQQIVQNANQKSRTQWRPLSVQKIALISDSDAAKQGFLQTMCLALAKTFPTQPYIRFVSAFTIEERIVPDNHKALVVTAISQRADFCRNLYEIAERDLKAFFPLYKLPFDSPERNRLLDKIKADHAKEMEQLNADFHVLLGHLSFSKVWTPVECIVDGTARTIIIQELPASTDYATYPDKLQTTSELMQFLAGLTRGPVTPVPGIDFVTKNPSLLRLMMDLLDHHGFKQDSIRVGLEDPEEWDYVNPQFDAESGLSAKS